MSANSDSLGGVPRRLARDAVRLGAHRLLALAIPVAASAGLLLMSSCARNGNETSGTSGGPSSVAQKREDVKMARLKEFAMAESPSAWETYQMLDGEIEIQSHKVEHLRKELVEFGRDPDQDSDYLKFQALLRDMGRVRADILAKLEEACVEKAFYDASPGRKDSEELWRKALEEGVRGAEASAQRFKEMRAAK